MSAPSCPSTDATQATFSGAGPAPDSLWTVLRRMWVTVSTRNRLAELDDRMLRDLGLSRADVAKEIARAPWDTTPVRRWDRQF